MERLKGKIVLVTGAGTGIGRAIAIRFAAEGAIVAINGRKEGPDLEETRKRVAESGMGKEESTPGAITVPADISQKEEVEAMFAKVLGSFGRLDVLVNNAGIQMERPSHKLTIEEVDQVLDVNLRGTTLCALAALRHFVSRTGGGVILNNTSVHEEIPKPKFLSYSMAKGGLRNLTRTLALEYAPMGIRVNSVGPGVVATRMNRRISEDDELRDEVEQHIPMRRVSTPEEIAAVFAFLASDEADYITGQTILVGGGLSLYPEFQQDWSSQ